MPLIIATEACCKVYANSGQAFAGVNHFMHCKNKRFNQKFCFEVYLLIILVCLHLENFESFLFEIFDVKIQVG